MAIRKWSPLAEMASMQREMDRMFREFVGREPWAFWRREAEWEPAAELVETKENLVLSVELPGVQAKDVDISVQEGAVLIKGEKRGVDRPEAQMHLGERYYGAFERKVDLPASAMPDGIKATIVDGVLTLTIAKREEAKRRPIPITAG